MSFHLRPIAPAPVVPPAQGDSAREPWSLKEYVSIFYQGRVLILGAVALALAIGVAYVLLSTPIYAANAVVQVEELVDPKNGGVQELTDMFSVKSAADTEIEILRSRSLLGGVVEGLALDLTAAPCRFPLVGEAWARRHDGEDPAPAVAGLTRFAWGGERIVLTDLQVPARDEGRQLTLTALGGDRYQLRDASGDVAVAGGVVGRRETGGDGRTSVLVALLRARPGTEFRVSRLPADEVVSKLQRSLTIAEVGRKTGVIRIGLTGPDPRALANVLNGIAHAYVRQNVERKSEVAEKTLAFISSQLPAQKTRLEDAEKVLNAYRSSHGSVDVSLSTTALIDRAADLEKQLSDLGLQRAELKERFTEHHNAVMGVTQKTAKLQAELAATEAKIKQLPDTELKVARLVRDVRVANTLYESMLNKAQELRVVKSGTVGNVRVLDGAPLPRSPVSPAPLLALSSSLLAGLVAGVAAVLARKAVRDGVEDPQELESATHIPVYATIPHSRAQGRLQRSLAQRPNGGAVLAASDPGDLAVESLRSLRSALQFALVDTASNVIAVTGPAPADGKSFVTLNLAHVIAASGQSVLLVDADLRNGQLHEQLGTGERSPGLSEVISGTARPENAIRAGIAPNLALLPTGAHPPAPSELLMSGRFRAVVEDLSRRYTFVLLDTPPCLAVTDASIVGRLAGVMLMVLRAGRHPIRELQEAVKRLGQAGVHTRGFVFNDVGKMPGRGGYGYVYAYQYEYRQGSKVR